MHTMLLPAYLTIVIYVLFDVKVRAFV